MPNSRGLREPRYVFPHSGCFQIAAQTLRTSDVASVASLPEMFLRRIASDGDRTALHIKRDGAFQSLSWREIGRDVCGVASVLSNLGVQPGDRVVQFSENRYEWILIDLAIQMVQAIHVPVHASLSAMQVAAQIRDSGARLAIVSGPSLAERLARASSAMPATTAFVSVEPADSPIGSSPVRCLRPLLGHDDLPTDGIAQECVDRLTPDTPATILYTSGTTGEPKGVVLSQRNLVTNTLAKVESSGLTGTDVRVTFLPLSHIFTRTCDLYSWIATGSQLALAESRETVLADCQTIKPTVISGVPYFYQQIHRRLAAQPVHGKSESVRQLLGGRIRCCFTGGAGLPDYLYDFFWQQDVPLLQGYGLTEASPVIAASSCSCTRRGACGKPIRDAEVRIAADGEVLTRGPHVMMGYWQRPEATREVVRDGWLHTGDVGHLDDDGFLYITGRKKEIIVTATGKNVAPVLLESRLTEDPLIAQAMVIGNDRNYLTAIIVPDFAALEKVSGPVGGRPAGEPLHRDQQIHQVYQRCIRQRLADLSDHEQVRKFTLIDRAFSVEADELTPKLSLRRKVIEAHFAEQIEAMYRE